MVEKYSTTKFKEIIMKDLSMLQLLVGTMSVMFLIISATFAGYWNFIAKKNRPVAKQETPPSVNTGESIARSRFQN
jgi:hypothetical protein